MVDERWGYSLAERSRTILEPIVSELQLGGVNESPLEVQFYRGHRVLVVSRRELLEGPRVDVGLRLMTKQGSFYSSALVEDAQATTKVEVTRALEKGVVLARERAATFFANPEGSRGRKRR